MTKAINFSFSQPAKGEGYRTNVDSIHLARFAAERPVRSVIDLGAGSGCIGLWLLQNANASHVTFVERDALAVSHLQTNVRENEFSTRATVVAADVSSLVSNPSSPKEITVDRASLIVCNPPYFNASKAPPSPESRRAAARTGSLAPFLSEMRRLLGPRGRGCLVYPVTEFTDLMVALRQEHLEPKRLRFVHPKLSAPARIVLVEVQGAKLGGLNIESPLIEIQ